MILKCQSNALSIEWWKLKLDRFPESHRFLSHFSAQSVYIFRFCLAQFFNPPMKRSIPLFLSYTVPVSCVFVLTYFLPGYFIWWHFEQLCRVGPTLWAYNNNSEINWKWLYNTTLNLRKPDIRIKCFLLFFFFDFVFFSSLWGRMLLCKISEQERKNGIPSEMVQINFSMFKYIACRLSK